MSILEDYYREKALGFSDFEKEFWIDELKKHFPFKADLRYTDHNNIFYEDDKKRINEYFVGKIPEDKIKIEYNLLKEKYLFFTITINLDKDLDFICEYSIDDKYQKLFKREHVGLSKLKHYQFVGNFNLDILKIETIFDEIIEFYNNYKNLVYKFENKKVAKEKKEKIITINKVSVENLAALYFDNYKLDIGVESIRLTLKYTDDVEISYRIKIDNFAATFGLIKEKSDMLKTNLMELSNCKHYSIEKLNMQKDNHRTLVAPDKIIELLNNKEELAKNIKSFLKDKIELRKGKAFSYGERMLCFDYLTEKSLGWHFIDRSNKDFEEFQLFFYNILDSEQKRIEDEYKESIFEYKSIFLNKYNGVQKITKTNVNDFFKQNQLEVPQFMKDLFWVKVNEELQKN